MKKKHILLSIVIMFTLCVKAQVYKYKTESISYKFKNYDGSWEDWSKWEETKVLVVINIDLMRISIYSKETQVYDIAEYEGKIIDSDGDENIVFYCIDSKGKTCRVKLLTIKNNQQRQIYINYSDVIFAYNIYYIQ